MDRPRRRARARITAFVVFAAVCVLVGGAAGAFSSAGRVQSARYVGGTGDVDQFALGCETERVSVGGACFDVVQSDRLAEISVADESGRPVAWAYELVSSDGTVRESTPIVCASVLTVELPESFEGSLHVTTHTSAGLTDCANAVPATSGIVAAGFSDEEQS